MIQFSQLRAPFLDVSLPSQDLGASPFPPSTHSSSALRQNPSHVSAGPGNPQISVGREASPWSPPAAGSLSKPFVTLQGFIRRTIGIISKTDV